MTNIKRICVFASASIELDQIYYSAASELGKLIGQNNYDLVYGGSHRGLMYATAKAAKENGSKIYAAMPQKMVDVGFANPEDCEEFYITEGMRERKAKIDSISDAVIAVAGGFGTLEEISEMIVQKQLGYNKKPIVLLNTAGFYDNLIQFFDTIVSNNFAKNNSKDLYYIANSPQNAIDYINSYNKALVNSSDKF